MKTVYIVSSGAYSSYEVEGVFSSREKAEGFVAAIGPQAEKDEWRRRRIEEYTLDLYERQIREGLSPWYVRMTMDGAVTDCRSKDDLHGIDKGARVGADGKVYATVFARDPQHAAKIVNEMRVQIKAQNA